MTPMECAREREVVRVVMARCWPDGADAELRDHVDSCAVCGDAVAVAMLLGSERDASLHDVRVPAPGQIWWRAALRAHTEAIAAARRPLVWLQGIAGASAVALVAALVSLAWPSMSDAAAAIVALRPDVAPLIETLRSAAPVAIVVIACLVLTPVAVYFALSDD